MIDLESMFTAVKCSWVIRIINANDTELWTMIAKHVYKLHENDFLLFKLHFTNPKTAPYFDNLSNFYKQIVLSFNKSKCMDIEYFRKNILDQPIWCNDFVTCNKRREKMTLYFKDWIQEGIVKIGDLKFDNGVLDEHFVYRRVKKKTNILSQVLSLKKALKPYA